MRWSFKLPRWQPIVLGLFVLLSLIYVQAIEPTWIEIKQVSLRLPHLDRAFENYKIVQVTDIHADPWMNHERLAKIVELVNQQQPDLIALTGDYVTHSAERYAPTLTALSGLTSQDGTLAVLGNHDEDTNPKIVTTTLTQSGIQVLRNQVHDLRRGDAVMHIAGVGDVTAGDADIKQVMAAMPKTGMGIMLAHEPDFADTTANTQRFDLQLSGHSHGGQVFIPLVKRVLPPLGEKYPIGQYQVGKLQQYTSRGVGTSGLRVRFNCRPEITVLTLHGTPA
jgi:uncharacterized protein